MNKGLKKPRNSKGFLIFLFVFGMMGWNTGSQHPVPSESSLPPVLNGSHVFDVRALNLRLPFSQYETLSLNEDVLIKTLKSRHWPLNFLEVPGGRIFRIVLHPFKKSIANLYT